ncbi:MAG: hypothetical protein IKH46_02680, partial [Lachnospiraceae bacterium]|nr:hypothetical protein [Lachnospiraceae bacterium]
KVLEERLPFISEYQFLTTGNGNKDYVELLVPSFPGNKDCIDLIICKVLDVTPEWLLSGVETHGTRSNPAPIIAVDVRTEAGQLLETYNSCDAAMQARILGYAQAIGKIGEDKHI